MDAQSTRAPTARRIQSGWSERLASWTAEQTLKTALVGVNSGRLRRGYSAVAIRVLLLINRANQTGRGRPASQFHYLNRRLR